MQELTQAIYGEIPTYILVSESGPDHKKSFEIALSVNGVEYARAKGSSKKMPRIFLKLPIKKSLPDTKIIIKIMIREMMNTFGVALRISTFGRFYGEGIGCVIDGLPAGLKIDENFIEFMMKRRAPA